MTVMGERRLSRARVVALVALIIAGTLFASLDPLTLLFFLAYGLVGGYLVVRRPRNSVGWLLIAIAFGFVATTMAPDLDVAALLRGDAPIRDEVYAWLGFWSGSATFVGFLALTIIFPSGRLPASGGRRTSVALMTVGVAMVALVAFAPWMGISSEGPESLVAPNPFAVLPGLAIWSVLPLTDGGVTVVVVLLVIGVVRMVGRYRGSVGTERLQLRWLVAAIAAVLGGIVFGLAASAFGFVSGVAAWIPVIVAYPTIPLAIGIAIMRYRLFDIDRIISRTIAYGAVVIVLAAVFAAGVLVISSALASFAFAQAESIAVAAATLLTYAVLKPVLVRVRRDVDRRFDRTRYDAERTVQAFAVRLRYETNVEAVTSDLAATTRAVVAPTSTSLWLRPSGSSR